jgi:hypothetical protein
VIELLGSALLRGENGVPPFFECSRRAALNSSALW